MQIVRIQTFKALFNKEEEATLTRKRKSSKWAATTLMSSRRCSRRAVARTATCKMEFSSLAAEIPICKEACSNTAQADAPTSTSNRKSSRWEMTTRTASEMCSKNLVDLIQTCSRRCNSSAVTIPTLNRWCSRSHVAMQGSKMIFFKKNT